MIFKQIYTNYFEITNFFSEIYHIRVSSFLRVSLFCRFHHCSPLHKLLGGFSAMMVEEETMGGVERSNLLHVLSIKFEVEEIQILLHSFLVNGLRDDDYVALQQPAQGYLCGSLAVFLANLGEGRVGSGST